jgi:hypothetical protein
LDAVSNGPPLSGKQTSALPLSERIIAPTQRRRRPPIRDWASSASPRADTRARIRTAPSPNWPTSASIAHGLPRSPPNSTRYAKLFVDRTLEVSLHAASKAASCATLRKVTSGKPHGHDATARKAAADKRRTATSATATARPLTCHQACWRPTAAKAEMMVWPAVPIHAPPLLPSCDIACDEDGGSGSASARAAKS